MAVTNLRDLTQSKFCHAPAKQAPIALSGVVELPAYTSVERDHGILHAARHAD